MAPRTRPSTLRTSCPFLFFVSMIDWLHGANGSRRPRDDAEEFPLFIGHSFLLENFLECFRSDLMSLIDNIIIKYDCRSRVCIYWWISFDSDASNREQRWTSSDGRRLVHVGTNAADAPALPAKLVCDLFRPLVRFDTVISLLSFFLFPPTLSLSRLHFTGDQKKKGKHLWQPSRKSFKLLYSFSLFSPLLPSRPYVIRERGSAWQPTREPSDPFIRVRCVTIT